MNNFVVVMTIKDSNCGTLPSDGFIVAQTTALTGAEARRKAIMEAHYMYGGSVDIVNTYPIAANILTVR